MKYNQLVADGYNKMANTYLADRDRLKSGKYVSQLLKYLPKQSTILDLGCGAGVPVDDLLLKAGHSVVGIDISSEQIKLARKHCPRGEFLVGDISDLQEGDYSVEAVVSFYTFFHTPREQQGKLLKIIASYLEKGGLLLISMGDREFEGDHELHGVKMWSSQFGTAKNRTLVESAGFVIIVDELDNSGGERHQIILAKRR
jgi:ubiquinone/menaquinone biosynthesis C-methylase UbiE